MKDALQKILYHRKKTPLLVEGYSPCAVLVPIFLKQGRYFVLFTKRSLEVKDHKGQISFPGGRFEHQDQSLLETALRETTEEIGIPSHQVEVLGELEDLLTPTKYRITPFVGMIPHPFPYLLNQEEIQEIIEVPLDHLLEPKNQHHGRLESFEVQTEIPYFQYHHHIIWGATGKITRELVDLIKNH